MEREIKFRAYNTSTGQMLPTIDIKTIYSTSKGSSTNLIWLQFTGLKDKNGKEIFEGDIVVYFYDEVLINGQKISERGCNSEAVIFHNSMFCMNLDDDFSLGNWAKADDLEVMGNTYENPELINNQY